MTTALPPRRQSPDRAAGPEPDGWSRSSNGNPYVNRPGIHATLYRSKDPDEGWLLFSTAYGRRGSTILGPTSEPQAKRRAEEQLNIARDMRRTRIKRCRELIEAGAKAPPDQRDRILDQAAALARQVSDELRLLPKGAQRQRDQTRLDEVIAAGAAARKAVTML